MFGNEVNVSTQRFVEQTDQRASCLASSEFLAFRHLFRGASIALMRWDKLSPLVAKVDQTYVQTRQELETFRTFLQSQPAQ